MAMPYCLICHNIYLQADAISSTRCGHVYHSECLTEWLNTAPTCPQCRNECNAHQISRIYIDFACDEDLACAQSVKTPAAVSLANSDAEETIKLLLEHIDTEPEKTSKSDHECEYCKEILLALDDTQDEKDKIKQSLAKMKNENDILIAESKIAMKRIEELDMKIKADEHNFDALKEQLEISEKFAAAIQSENLYKQDKIDGLKADIQSKIFDLKRSNQQVEEVVAELKATSIKHASEIHDIYGAIQANFKGIWQRKLLKRQNKEFQHSFCYSNKGNSDSQELIPYCGNIDNWDYMMIPILKNNKQKN